MKFTKSIFFKDGNSLTITEQEAKAIQERLLAGDRWVEVQSNFISADNVARIGNHTSTADIKKWNESNLDRALIAGGKGELVDAKRKMLEKMAMNENAKGKDFEKRLLAGDPEALRIYNAIPDEPKKLMTAEESERGDAEYWVNEAGEKHYS